MQEIEIEVLNAFVHEENSKSYLSPFPLLCKFSGFALDSYKIVAWLIVIQTLLKLLIACYSTALLNFIGGVVSCPYCTISARGPFKHDLNCQIQAQLQAKI